MPIKLGKKFDVMQLMVLRLVSQFMNQILNSAPLIADYFAPESLGLASALGTIVQSIASMATGGFLSQLAIWTNGAVPFYVVGIVTLAISFDSLFGLKDIVAEQDVKRSMSMREEDRSSVVAEKKNPCVKAARIFKIIGAELVSDARFFVSLSVMATLKLCFITFSFTNPYL